MSGINDRALRETVDLALYTKVAMGDVAHNEDMQSFLQYALTATSTQLNNHSEGEKMARVLNTLKEVMELPEAAGWKAAVVNEINSLKELEV